MTSPTQTVPDTAAAPSGPSPAEGRPTDPFVRIIEIARTATSRSRFMGSALRVIARFFETPYAALHVRYATEVLQDDCHFGKDDPRFWQTNVQQFLTESLAESRCRARLLRSRSGNAKIALFSVPIYDPSGPAIGAMALVVTPISERDVTAALARLEALSRLASFAVEILGTAQKEATVSKASAQALTHGAKCGSTEELAFSITNELRNKLGCQQVALGLVRGRRVKVISISGLDEVRKQSPGVVSLTGAMEECLDAGEPIAYQRDGGFTAAGMHAGFLMHKQWHASAGGDAVASVPLRVGDGIVAILSIRQVPNEPFTAERLDQIRTRVEPFAPALILTGRANRSLPRHMLDRVRDGWHALAAPGHIARKVAAIAIVAFLAWFALGTMNFKLAVPARVTAAEIRHLSAPFDGLLVSAGVVQGDRVAQGDVLCRLDDRELQQQRKQLLAELRVMEHTADLARAGESYAEVKLAEARQELIRTKLEIVNRKIEQATVRAPIHGVIVDGDLRKHVGSVVARGDAMFQVAPLDHWTLELEVPESAVDELAPELAGVFASYARPETAYPFSVSRVLATAEVRDTRNVFIAEAHLRAKDPGIRPGMDGFANIHVGPRKVWWVALHRAIDWLRINFWL